jgi:uroporphyrinogen-III synthase
MLDENGRRELAGTPAFVSHPRIADRAHALKLTRVIVTEPTDAGLIAALLQYFDVDS